jgi:ribosomal protein S18 acetylase RimI-like enzyme
MSANIIEISSDRIDAAVEILTLSFQNYPLTRYFLSGQENQLKDLFRLCCDWRFALQWQLVGVLNCDRLVAVACLTEPDIDLDPELMMEVNEKFRSVLGESTVARLEKYNRMQDEHRLPEPHFYLQLFGVDPNEQGKGYGRILLEEIHARSQAHPTSIGVCLDTETSENVELYQYLGYRVTTKTQIDGVNIWCMFRPD